MRKPDCQLTSADCSDLSQVCNTAQIKKHSHPVNADVYVLKGSKMNLLDISELSKFALNDVKCNRVLGWDILGNKWHCIECYCICWCSFYVY